MAVPVKLKDIIEGLEFLTDEGGSYLNTVTGEVVYVTTEELRAAEEEAPLEDFPDWQHDAIRTAGEIIETDHYLPLPDKFEINEYRIMERFCLSVEDEDMRDDLCNAIRGRGAFRYFKDKIHEYGIAEDWYQYRDAALKEIAIAWCEAHGIAYTE
jgi:Uncharacterised protein family (UPF0158)